MEQNIEDIINMQALPEHVAIIMDGNRRWAKKNNLSTPQGHKEGAENLKRIAKFANKIGIKHLTVYAFSTENWKTRRGWSYNETFKILFVRFLQLE